ncbi:phospholipase b [Moniliophthora roreri]|uniref:Lysophospholipase n=1 Tax=Moniliophthora roreri TaxID=221103 RepID=A0A0W0F0C0_MONRR|nr:phospholipase b [Moniliophthora roreri]
MLLFFLYPALALGQAVTDYAPKVNIPCPDLSTFKFVREWTPQNQSLNADEETYINTRQTQVLPAAWKDWLGDASQLGYDFNTLAQNLPKVGIAIPGGGLRAAQYGAAALSGLDARNDSAKAAGTGGLLQVASYITGLSGGSWITSSLIFNNFPTLHDLVFGSNTAGTNGWQLNVPFVTPDGTNLFSDFNQYFFGSILWSVMAKAKTGIDTSLTDPWARMISYHFLNQTTPANFFTNDSAHGAGQLWSSMPNVPAFANHQVPLPILVSDSRPVGSNYTTALPLEPTVYEITPFELASYDPDLSAGANITFAGTHLTNGKPANGSACVTGFDQVGFMMGTSASLFNQILDFAHNTLEGFSDSDGAGLLYVLSRQLSQVRTRADDVANWPSPFNGIKNSTFRDSSATWLELLDGASNGENVPYAPLFVRARGLDVIVTLEGSADDPNNWPNGSSPITTATRQQKLLQSSHQEFPPIPMDPQVWIDTGIRARPTFFGCNPQNKNDYPLVIYLPNAPPLDGSDPAANSATFRLTYTIPHTRLIFEQVHKNTIGGFVPGTNDPDPDFGKCLQCAAIDRARLALSIQRSDICTRCFDRYCYDPQSANQPNAARDLSNRRQEFVDPDPQGLDKLGGFIGRNKGGFIGGIIGLVVLIGAAVGGLIWWKKRRERERAKGEYKRVSALTELDGGKGGYEDYVRGDVGVYEMRQ